MSTVNNKKIARNTILLYVRMLLLMAVSLYTSRVILQVLGVDDYGIYNLVGGFISIFSFVSSAMVAAVQRFFNVAIGENDEARFIKTYSMAMNMFFVFSILLLMVCGCLGWWFVSTQLNLPDGRQNAAMWVFYISVITSIVHLFRSPDNAAIIAFEEMDFYAYISIVEAILKLAIVFMLLFMDYDKLVLYCVLYLLSTIVINLIYKWYVNRSFSMCRYHFIWDTTLFRQLTTFSGWNLLTQGTHIAQNQGESFLTNKYYNVSFNAARGVASQVYNAVNLFLINFQTSFKPQLIKSYAAGELKAHHELLNRSSRLSFFLLSLIVVPIVFNLDGLLSCWLVEVPPFTREFCLYIMLAYLFDAIGAPFCTSVMANGNVMGLSICSSLLYAFGLCASYLGFCYTSIPYITAIVCLLVHILMVVCYLYYAHKWCEVSITSFARNVMLPIILVSPLLFLGPWMINSAFDNLWICLVLDGFVDIAIVMLLGTNKHERTFILSHIPIIKKYTKGR